MKVVVIGAGLVGLTTAVELDAAGHEVTIVDPAPASGATHHAGGMLAPAAEVVYQQDPLYPLMLASARRYPALLELVGDVPTGYRTEGTLVVAADRADAQHLAELALHQSKHGMEVERLTVRQARKLEPALSPQLAGAVHIPGDHQVYPRMLADSLCQRFAGRIVREEAVAIEGDTVVTTGSRLRADQIVVACGLGAKDLGLGIELPLRPVYGDIIRLRPRTPILHKVVRGFVNDRPVYLIPRVDGTLAIGATSREDSRPLPEAGGVYQLMRDAIRVLPGVEDADFLEATAGTRPGTPDDLPYLGRISEHVVVSTGYFRHGILLSALAAQVGRELVEGQTPSIDIAACDPARFDSQKG